MHVRSYVNSYEYGSLWSECMTEFMMLCNKDKEIYENAWRLYKAKHCSSCKRECRRKIQYNKFSPLPFPLSSPLCFKSDFLPLWVVWVLVSVSVSVRAHQISNKVVSESIGSWWEWRLTTGWCLFNFSDLPNKILIIGVSKWRHYLDPNMHGR